MAKNYVRGAAKLRKKLRAMPVVIQSGVKAAIRTETLLVRDAIRAATPESDEGIPKDWQGTPRKHLREAIKGRFSLKGLRGAVGITGKDKRIFFFAKFLEYGFRGRGTKRDGKRGPPKPVKITKYAFFRKTWGPLRPVVEAHMIRETKRAFDKAAKL
jgi:hypothetical protein